MNEQELITSLRESGYRITRVRRLLLRVFLRERHPVGVREILKDLESFGHAVNKTTVYREIDFLLREGYIRRVQLLGRAARYEIAVRAHHHHIICTHCEHVEDVEVDTRLCHESDRLKKQTGFRNIHHALEFFGVCANCQNI